MAKRISGEEIYRKLQTPKKTSIGNGKVSKTMMNKSKRRSYKRYRGQGK